jgi:hypothetical protein
MICAVQCSLERNSASLFAQITSNNAAVPLFHEGRFAIVTDVERDAVDADGADDDGARSGRRSRVVLTSRRWRQVVMMLRITPMTVTNKPDHRREHEGNR